MNSYYEKARIIELIKKTVLSKGLDPNFNTGFEIDSVAINEILPKEILNNVVV